MPPATGDGRKRSVIATKSSNNKANSSVPTQTSTASTRSHLTVSSSKDHSPSSSSSSSAHLPVSPRTPLYRRDSLSASYTPRPRRHSHSDGRPQQPTPSSDTATAHPPPHFSVSRQASLTNNTTSDSKTTRTKQPSNTAAINTRNRNNTSPAPTPSSARRPAGQAWSSAKSTRVASRSVESDRGGGRGGESRGGQKDEELDVLLDALMPRLVRRMQRALEHVKPFAPASTLPSSSSYTSAALSTISPSASFDSADSSLSAQTTDLDLLVQRGVTDALQQLFNLLLHPVDTHDTEEAAECQSEETSAGGSGAEYVATPSMQLLGDVSYHAGSSVSVGQQLLKVWSVKNSGDTLWPEQVRLLPATSPAAATAPYGLESDVILFTDLPPGDTMNVSVLITAPTVAGRHVGRYQLAFCQPADKQWVRFGDELTIDLVCQQPTTSSSSASAAAASTTASSSAATAAADTTAASAADQSTSHKKAIDETKHSSDSVDHSSSSSSLDTSAVSEMLPSTIPRRPLSRSSEIAAEEEKERRRERKKDKLRVDRGKDRSQSVDSKPPTLSTNDWWGLVHADAVPATVGGSTHPQPSAAASVTAAPRMPTVMQSPSHLMSFGPTAGNADDEEALDWLKHASVVSASSAAATTTSGPSGTRNLMPSATQSTSKSASHSRSNSPALPPSNYAQSSVPMFARSTSQSFAPGSGNTGGSVTSTNGELLSPPLTPTVPSGSLLSKDDLMSWAGGQGLMTTNKQTGVQSATHTASQQPQPPTVATASATSAAAGPPATPLGSSLSHSFSTIPRQTSSTLSPNSSRTRHSMPPAARIVLPSSSSAFNLSTQQQQQQQGGAAGQQSYIPDFLKEETARLSSGKQ